MADTFSPQRFLDFTRVDDAVFALRPDYRAIVIAVDGLTAGPSDKDSDALLARAEAVARQRLRDLPVEDWPHIAAWRQAYRSFGAKPQRTRNSVEALCRRAEGGLPRVNSITDVYNAMSVLHQLPMGGEDLSHYRGAPRLVRAAGDEPFETTADGTVIVDHPDPGEVVWRDDAGVTCRRWNWRQTRRTLLTEHTSRALFILDALEPMTDEQVHEAADNLITHVRRVSPEVRVARRFLSYSPAT